MRIMQMIVIEGYSLSEFEDACKNALAAGLQPYGSLCVSHRTISQRTNECAYTHTFVEYAEAPEDEASD